MTKHNPKWLAFDIETAPAQVYAWGLHNQFLNIGQIIEHPRIIAFSAQWYGSKQVIFKSEYHDGQEAMLAELHRLFDEAQLLVGWNSNGFDIKWVEGELQLAGFKPPSPFHKLDLMQHFRRHSRFVSKKLDYVSERLLAENKVTHDGFEMWRACIEPDYDPVKKKRAWTLMKKYAIKDTKLLWPIFESIRGWVKLPITHSADAEYSCPNCGSLEVQRRGIYTTQASVYQRWQCQEEDCGKWGRSVLRERVSNLIRPL